MNPETTTENHNSKIQPMVGRGFKKYSFIMILIVLSWHFFFFEVWQIVLNLFEMNLGTLITFYDRPLCDNNSRQLNLLTIVTTTSVLDAAEILSPSLVMGLQQRKNYNYLKDLQRMAFRIRANWCLTGTEALEIEKENLIGLLLQYYQLSIMENKLS